MIAALALAAALAPGALHPLPQGQLSYSRSCGGCHGLMGVSAKDEVPDLRNRVGIFLCSSKGRDYVVRLPNVAFAAMDDETLAGALNFMMFDLGGPSVPSNSNRFSRPFTAQEVNRLRVRPLKARNLLQLRTEALAMSSPECLASSPN